MQSSPVRQQDVNGVANGFSHPATDLLLDSRTICNCAPLFSFRRSRPGPLSRVSLNRSLFFNDLRSIRCTYIPLNGDFLPFVGLLLKEPSTFNSIKLLIIGHAGSGLFLRRYQYSGFIPGKKSGTHVFVSSSEQLKARAHE